MKTTSYISAFALGLSLILSLVVFFVGERNQRLVTDPLKAVNELHKLEELQEHQKRALARFQGDGHRPELLRDVAIASLKDGKMRDLLEKHGYRVNYKGSATPAPLR